MISAFMSLFSARPSRRTSAHHHRSRMMARVMVDHGNEGRRTRSRSVPGTSHQAVIDGAQASVTTPASTTPSLKEQSSSSQNCMGNTEPTSFMENGGIIDDLKARIKRAADLNANLKEQARCAEADVRFAIEQRNALQEMLEGYERREQSKSGEILQAKADIQHLEKCLDGCKEQIFKMQPLQHMTDSEIADQYRLLCESISDWTDNHFGDCENSFGRLQECCGEEISGKLIHKYLVQDGQINVVRKYPLAGSTMITFLIHRHLYQSILRENLCYPSLDEKCEDFVSFMENEMRHNEPRRDEDTIHNWLTEVQRTLSTSPKMKSLREKYLDSRCSELSKLLVSLLPANQRTTFRRQDLRKLFSEAADLATNIRLSPATYLFACNYGEGNPLYLGENRAFKIINQASGQPIRSSDVFKSNQDGKIGEKLCLIHPALVRKGKESGRDVNLVKATMLCSFDYLMARRRKTKDAE